MNTQPLIESQQTRVYQVGYTLTDSFRLWSLDRIIMAPNLCAGHCYRSRYAEEVFHHRAKLEGLDWLSFSRAAAEKLSPEDVGPISPFALEALQAKGIAAGGTARNPLLCTVADFPDAELVVALKDGGDRCAV
jgi:protein-tyrosine-phosphatase